MYVVAKTRGHIYHSVVFAHLVVLALNLQFFPEGETPLVVVLAPVLIKDHAPLIVLSPILVVAAPGCIPLVVLLTVD